MPSFVLLTDLAGNPFYINLTDVVCFSANVMGGSTLQIITGPYWSHGNGSWDVQEAPTVIAALTGSDWLRLTDLNGNPIYVNFVNVICFNAYIGPPTPLAATPFQGGSVLELMHGQYWSSGSGRLYVAETPAAISQTLGATHPIATVGSLSAHAQLTCRATSARAVVVP